MLWYDAVVVHDRGIAESQLDRLAGFQQRVGIDLVVITEGERRLRHARDRRGLHYQSRQLVAGVLAARPLPAERYILEEREAGEGTGRHRIHQLDDRGTLYPDVGQQFHGLFIGEPPIRDIFLIVRIHVLVEAPEQHRVGIGLDLGRHVDQPDGLKRLAEV